MNDIIKDFTSRFLNKNIQDNFRVGDFIKVYQKIKEGGKEKQIEHQGLVIAKKHGKGLNATFTIRNVYQGIGVEKIFPLHLPSISRIEVLKKAQKVRTAKLYWVRDKSEKDVRKRLRLQDLKGKSTGLKKDKKEEQVKS